MTLLAWDAAGSRFYETGTDRGVLYLPNAQGVYDNGVAWNGILAFTHTPTGAQATPHYADNIKYLNLYSAEQLDATLEAYTYPNEFNQFDGIATPVAGVAVGQQNRKSFGLSHRTMVGNDLLGTDLGYKIHLVYGAMASPTAKPYKTVNDKQEAMTFNWSITTTPVAVPGFKPAALLTIDSTQVPAAQLATLENILYGSAGTNPRLPLPAEVLSIFTDTLVFATPVAPTYTLGTHTIVIPTVTGLAYQIDGVTKTGSVVITKDTVVKAVTLPGYKLPLVTDVDWFFSFT